MQESDKVVVNTDSVTLKGNDFLIETDDHGYYRIRTTGEGIGPFHDERFTGLAPARKRISEYEGNNEWRLRLFNSKKVSQRKKEVVNGESES